MYKFSKRSLSNLATCHPLLQALAQEAIKTFDFTVIEGHRNKAKQMEAYANKTSKLKWPRSKHNKMPSEAFDAIPYPFPGWSGTQSKAAFQAQAEAILAAWEALGDQTAGWKLTSAHVSWGWDSPHFQIERTIDKKS
jgi:peptidoglycan L-alanyl-D-glutamate endopeptidase CwlK